MLTSCTALRAYRSGSGATVKQYFVMWAPVARCFDAHPYDCVTRAQIRGHEGELVAGARGQPG